MTATELRELSIKELNEKLQEAKRALMDIRFKLATKQQANNREIVSAKKDVARILTIINEKEGASKE